MSSRHGGGVNAAPRGKVGPMPRFFACLVALLACDSKLSEEEFEAKLADKVCSLYFECKGGKGGEAPFDDEAGCHDYYVDFFHDAGCDFDPDQGQACLDAIDVDDCAEDSLYPDECDDVFLGKCSKDD